jgi:hypothetical protein
MECCLQSDNLREMGMIIVRLQVYCLILVSWGIVTLQAAEPSGKPVRVATFNIQELTAKKLASVDAKGHGNQPQLLKAAEILQRIRPDVVLINEIDYDVPTEAAPSKDHPYAAQLFLDRYLKVGQQGLDPLDYPHMFYQPVNTGVPTGLDLDNDGSTDGPADGYGFGRYPGQHGMVLFSRYPLDVEQARTFRLFRWIDLPGALIPDGKSGKPAFLSAEEVERFRLSSKSHWDVPVKIGERSIHLLCSHPTPPVFDKEEDINGRRNFDEIRLWADYLSGGQRAAYLRDDRGRTGGLAADSDFIVLGDLNSDPTRSDATYGKVAIQQLLEIPELSDPRPSKVGWDKMTVDTDSKNADLLKTSHFGRLDYVLPSRSLKTKSSGVFYPPKGDPLRRLVDRPNPASDHDLVWVDLDL